MKRGRLQGSNEKLWMNRSSSFSSFHFWSLSTIFGRSGHKRETFVYGIWDFPITAKQHLSANGPVNLAKIVFKILLRSSSRTAECYSWEKQTKFNFTSFYFEATNHNSLVLTPLFFNTRLKVDLFMHTSILHAFLKNEVETK